MTRFGKTGAAALTYVSLAALQRGVSLIILPFVTHAMPPTEYGAASMLSAASLFVTTLIAAPLIPLIIRVTARADDDGPALLRAAGIYCYIIVPAAVFLLALLATCFVSTFLNVSGAVWGIELLAIGLQPAASTFALWVAQARENLKKFVLISSTSVVLTMAAKALLVVVLRLGVLGWALSDLISAALTATLAWVVIRLPRADIHSRHVRYIFNFTLPLIPHSASLWALNSLSRPAMAAVSTLDQVGLFSFGLNLAAVSSLALAEGNRAVLPRYSREVLPAPTRETLEPVRWQIIAAFIVPALVGAAVASVGPWIFAHSYRPAFVFTGVLLIAQAAYGLYAIPMNYITQTAGLTRYSALASGAGAGIILIGILAFGRRYGALGISITTAAGFTGMAIVALVLTLVHHLHIGWSSWRPDLPAILLAATALTSSIFALSSPTGSIQAWALLGSCLLATAGSLFLAFSTRAVVR